MKLHSAETHKIIEDLIKKSYQKASDSFSNLAEKKVDVKGLDIKFSDPEHIVKMIPSQKKLTILITEIIGDCKGKSYLILNEYEVEMILKMMLSKMKNFEANEYFQDIILKEIDNVLAASVITEFSNFLNIRIYGDVPSVAHPTETSVEWLKKEFSSTKGVSAILSTASFVFEEDVKIKPSFLWVLDKKFYDAFDEKQKVDADR